MSDQRNDLRRRARAAHAIVAVLLIFLSSAFFRTLQRSRADVFGAPQRADG